MLALYIHGYFILCLTGIIHVLNYTKDVVGSKVIFINSLYDSNDDDHMAIADHRKIKNVFGTMDDFGLLRNITKEKKGIFEEWMVIIPPSLKEFSASWNLYNWASYLCLSFKNPKSQQFSWICKLMHCYSQSVPIFTNTSSNAYTYIIQALYACIIHIYTKYRCILWWLLSWYHIEVSSMIFGYV